MEIQKLLTEKEPESPRQTVRGIIWFFLSCGSFIGYINTPFNVSVLALLLNVGKISHLSNFSQNTGKYQCS